MCIYTLRFLRCSLPSFRPLVTDREQAMQGRLAPFFHHGADKQKNDFLPCYPSRGSGQGDVTEGAKLW